jgi:hypothetical protein
VRQFEREQASSAETSRIADSKLSTLLLNTSSAELVGKDQLFAGRGPKCRSDRAVTFIEAVGDRGE